MQGGCGSSLGGCRVHMVDFSEPVSRFLKEFSQQILVRLFNYHREVVNSRFIRIGFSSRDFFSKGGKYLSNEVN